MVRRMLSITATATEASLDSRSFRCDDYDGDVCVYKRGGGGGTRACLWQSALGPRSHPASCFLCECEGPKHTEHCVNERENSQTVMLSRAEQENQKDNVSNKKGSWRVQAHL